MEFSALKVGKPRPTAVVRRGITKRAKETDKVTVVQTSSEPVNLEIVKYMVDHTRILVISL